MTEYRAVTRVIRTYWRLIRLSASPSTRRDRARRGYILATNADDLSYLKAPSALHGRAVFVATQVLSGFRIRLSRR